LIIVVTVRKTSVVIADVELMVMPVVTLFRQNVVINCLRHH